MAERPPRPVAERYLVLARPVAAKLLETEATFRSVTAEYRTGAESRPGEAQAVADTRAGNDRRIRQAIGDGAWHRERAMTFALLAIAEKLIGGGR